MPPDVIRLREKAQRISAPWTPGVVAALNDYRVKLARLEGEFVWHAHADTDELFYVLEGRLRIEFRDGTAELDAGDLLVVPRGVEHRPVSASGCTVMLIEPQGVVNTGESGRALTAPIDAWL